VYLESESDIEKLGRKKLNYQSFFGILPNYNSDVLLKKARSILRGLKGILRSTLNLRSLSNNFLINTCLTITFCTKLIITGRILMRKEQMLEELWISSRKE